MQHDVTCTVSQGQMVDADYYISVLKQLIKDHIPKKHPDVIKNWKLYQDNARPLGFKRLFPLSYIQKGFKRTMFSHIDDSCEGFRGDFEAAIFTGLRARLCGVATVDE